MYRTFHTPKSSLISLGVLIVQGLTNEMTTNESTKMGKWNSWLTGGSDFPDGIGAVFCMFVHVFLPTNCVYLSWHFTWRMEAEMLMVLCPPTIALQAVEEPVAATRFVSSGCPGAGCSPSEDGDGARACAGQTGESGFGCSSPMWDPQRVGAPGAGGLAWQR